MGTPTYIPLATVTLASTDSEIVFGSIPQGYRDLILVASYANSSTTDEYMRIRLNGDTGSNYSNVWMFGNGSSAGSGSSTIAGTLGIQLPETSGQFNVSIHSVMDYSATDKHKTILSRAEALAPRNTTNAFVTRWANTAAVTSLTVTTELGASSYSIGSTFSLFGIAG